LFWATIAIKNFGRTPAKITDILVKPIILPNGETLPTLPNYSRNRQPTRKAFLVSQEEFYYSEAYSISSEQMAAVKNTANNLYLIGFVDYVDQFEQRHREGYARRYYPMLDDRESGHYKTDAGFATRNNLLYVTEEGYNYDRKRERSEGNDWNEL
jgi:hypothetical protein